MKKNAGSILVSYGLFFVLFGIVFSDLAGLFGFGDMAFLCGFLVYGLILFIQKAQAKISFVMALFFLIFMGMSYIPTGAGQTTERIGEWFYLFFLSGLIHGVFSKLE